MYSASTATPDDKYALIYTPCSPEVCKGNTGEASVVCHVISVVCHVISVVCHVISVILWYVM